MRWKLCPSLTRVAMQSARDITRLLKRREQYRLIRNISEQLSTAVLFCLGLAAFYALIVISMLL